MNISQQVTKFFGLGSLALTFGFTAAVTRAGPPPQFWNRPVSVATAKDTPKAAPVTDANGMACPACKTVTLRDSKWVGPAGKAHIEWFDIGVKHTCANCGGEIKVVRGVTTNSMKPNCTMCGKDAELCKAAVQAPASKA